MPKDNYIYGTRTFKKNSFIKEIISSKRKRYHIFGLIFGYPREKMTTPLNCIPLHKCRTDIDISLSKERCRQKKSVTIKTQHQEATL